MAHAADRDGVEQAVGDLQRGLNLILSRPVADAEAAGPSRGAAQDSGFQPKRPIPLADPGLGPETRIPLLKRNLGHEAGIPSLKVDGVLGPKTRSALHRAIRTDGAKRIGQTVGLGHFQGLIEKTKAEPGYAAGRLPQVMSGISAAPNRNPTGAEPPMASKPEVAALQAAMNAMGSEVAGTGGWRPLKEDGVLGPKTGRAFEVMAARSEPFDFARSFGRLFGIL